MEVERRDRQTALRRYGTDCRGMRVDDDDRDHAGFYLTPNAKLTRSGTELVERRVRGKLERKMEKRHIASFAVTPNLIEQALTMPEGHEIVGAEWDFASRTVRLFVEGPSLPEVERGQIVPSIVPSVTVAVCDDGKRVHTWNWNAANAKLTGDPQLHRGASSEQSERG